MIRTVGVLLWMMLGVTATQARSYGYGVVTGGVTWSIHDGMLLNFGVGYGIMNTGEPDHFSHGMVFMQSPFSIERFSVERIAVQYQGGTIGTLSMRSFGGGVVVYREGAEMKPGVQCSVAAGFLPMGAVNILLAKRMDIDVGVGVMVPYRVTSDR